MTHPGLNSTRLADMRTVLDEVALPDRERRAVEAALAGIQAEWENRKQQAYGEGVAERDRQHHEVLDAAEAFIDEITGRRDDVRNGRRTGREVRAWLRDARADFAKLVQQHQGIIASEAKLAEMEAQDPAAYQAQTFARFPSLANSGPTLAQRAGEILRRPRRSATGSAGQTKEELDAAQDELVSALKRFPAIGRSR